MATSAQLVHLPAAAPPAPTLRIFDFVPRFHDVVAVDAGTDTPLLRGGDVAVFDEGRLDPTNLEEGIYCIEYQSPRSGMPRDMFARLFVTPEGARLKIERRIVQVKRHRTLADHFMVTPLGTAIGRSIGGIPTFVCSDGPYDGFQLTDRLLGRVVGVYRPHIGDDA
jgi:hypothetical protein